MPISAWRNRVLVVREERQEKWWQPHRPFHWTVEAAYGINGEWQLKHEGRAATLKRAVLRATRKALYPWDVRGHRAESLVVVEVETEDREKPPPSPLGANHVT